MFVSPHDGRANGVDDCTEIATAPAFDTVFAVGLAAVAVTALAVGGGGDFNPTPTLGLGFGVPALIFSGSAVYGFLNVASCKTRNSAARRARGQALDVP